jgi:hypothetical protein
MKISFIERRRTLHLLSSIRKGFVMKLRSTLEGQEVKPSPDRLHL